MKSKFTNDKFFEFTLNVGTKLIGKYLENVTGTEPVKKIFFRTTDGKKEFCIKNLSVSFDRKDWLSYLKIEINEYLEFLLEQSKLEFPEWLSKNGQHAFVPGAVYTEYEILKEWKSMKNLFGTFRMAADCGFFSSKKPFEASINYVTCIRESKN